MKNSYHIVEARYDESVNAVEETVIRTWDNYRDAEEDFRLGARLGGAFCLYCHPTSDGISLASTWAYRNEYNKVQD